MTHFSHKKNKGFTLVETLVAIAILITVVSGAFTAAQTGLSSSTFSQQDVVATYLAQEGVEYIRNMRDENALKGQNWLAGIAQGVNDPCYFGNSCTIDAIAGGAPIACAGGHDSCPVVLQDPVNGFYGYTSGWTPSPFKRSITLTQVAANGGEPSEVSMVVTVTWQKGLAQRSFRVRENIFNWQ